MRSVTQARARCQCANPEPHLTSSTGRICLGCRGTLPSKGAAKRRVADTPAKPPLPAEAMREQLELHGMALHCHLMKWAAMQATTEDMSQRIIICIIAAHWNAEKRLAWPSVATIAKLAHCTRKHVHAKLNELERSCPALRRRRRYHRRRTSNGYEFQLSLCNLPVT